MVFTPKFTTLSEVSPETSNFLPELYFEAWSKEGLCSSLEEAKKVLHFDPQYSFVGLNEETGKPFGLLNTLPLSASELGTFINEGITYRHIEDLSRNHHRPTHLDILLCFSIVAEADQKVVIGDQVVSISRYMITTLKDLGIPVYVYTRKKSVGMHVHFGANPEPIAVIENSRPEDVEGDGVNIILQY